VVFLFKRHDFNTRETELDVIVAFCCHTISPLKNDKSTANGGSIKQTVLPQDQMAKSPSTEVTVRPSLGLIIWYCSEKDVVPPGYNFVLP